MMQYDVLLTQKDDKFIARICPWPGIVAESHTEAGALRQIQADLEALLANGRIVQLEVHTKPQEHPWQPYAGIFADDPDWDAFQESIREYRDEIDRTPDED